MHTSTRACPATHGRNSTWVTWLLQHLVLHYKVGISPTCQTSTGPSSGSTATALCEGWAIQKCVGIINIREDINFKLDPISLMIVIPMVFKTIAITDLRKVDLAEQDMGLNNAIEMQLKYEVEEMIAEAENQLTGHAMQCTRLRVQYTYESQELNSARFRNNFMSLFAMLGRYYYSRENCSVRQMRRIS